MRKSEPVWQWPYGALTLLPLLLSGAVVAFGYRELKREAAVANGSTTWSFHGLTQNLWATKPNRDGEVTNFTTSLT